MADAKSLSTTSSGKRKRITYYAVKEGHTPDIYYSWSDVLKQTTGYKDPKRAYLCPSVWYTLTPVQTKVTTHSQRPRSS